MDICGGRPGGFTLLDSLIVLVILGTIGMIIIPQFNSLLQETKLNEATTELVSGIQYAEALAVRHRRPFGFQTDAVNRWYKIYDNRYGNDSAPHTDQDPPVTGYGVVLNPLDKNWYFRDFDVMEHYQSVTFTSAQIVFYPDGHSAATDTTVTVSLGDAQRAIKIDGTTGQVSIQ